MASAELQSIYNRLNSVSNYHPYTADTFSDWSMEAGDTVTVSRNGTNYTSPIHNSTVKWNGAQKVSIESRGEKERGSVTKMAISSYSSSSGGGSSYRSGYKKNQEDKDRDTRISQNEEAIVLEAWDRQNADDIFESNLTVQAKKIEAEVTNRKEGDKELSGRLTVEAERITAEVKARKKEGSEIRGLIEVEAGRVSMLVDENGNVKAGVIVDAINNGTVNIDGSKIVISGTTTLNNIMTVTGGAVHISKPLYADGSYVMVNQLRLYNGPTLDESSMSSAIKSASVSGNVLTLTPFRGNAITFSKATTLSGEWSGNVLAGKSYKVEAKQNNVVVNTHYSPALDDIYPVANSKSWASNYKSFTQSYRVQDANGTDLFEEADIQFDTEASYNQGWRNAAGKFVSPTVYSTGDHIDIKYPTSTVDADASTRTYYITGDSTSDEAYIRVNTASGTRVAAVTHGAYSQGVIDGAASASHNITPGSSVIVNYSQPSGTRVGSAVNSAFFQSGSNYLTFTMSCGGSSKTFYIQVTK